MNLTTLQWDPVSIQSQIVIKMEIETFSNQIHNEHFVFCSFAIEQPIIKTKSMENDKECIFNIWLNNITYIYLQELLKIFSLSEDVLPKILPSADDFGKVIDGSTLSGIPISGVSRRN